MRRRDFVILLGGTAATWPLAARAQQAGMPMVGYLQTGSRAASSSLEAAFRASLSNMGFVEGQNVAIDYRYTEGQNDRLPALAADLVRRPVAVIYAVGTGPAATAKASTTTIPIVFRTGGDPVQLGFVTSLNRPGGNMTGVSRLATATTGIRMQMLHEGQRDCWRRSQRAARGEATAIVHDRHFSLPLAYGKRTYRKLRHLRNRRRCANLWGRRRSDCNCARRA